MRARRRRARPASCSTSAKASGTAISSANSISMRAEQRRRRRSSDLIGRRQKKVAPTWNSFSTSRTMRLRGTKTMTWSPLLDHRVVVRDDDLGRAALRPRAVGPVQPRTMAPICAPGGSASSSMRRPTTLRALAVAARHRLQRLGGAAAQAVHRLHVAAAHVRQQLADDGLRRRDRDVDLRALHQVGIGAAVDQRQHAPRAHALGQQAGHDVVLVVAGQREEQVHVLDVLVAPAGPRRCESPCSTSTSARQLRGQVLAARAAGLDELDLVVAPAICARQAQADVAAAGDHHARAPAGPCWRSAPSTARMCSVAASTKTSSPGSMRVLPSQRAVERRVLAVDGDDAHRRRPGTSCGMSAMAVLHQRPAGHRAHRDQAHQRRARTPAPAAPRGTRSACGCRR